MQDRPFTAIVTHRNRPESLARALDRLRLVWGNHLAEILVVDDGSESAFVPSPNQLGSGTTMLRLGSNVGPARARNIASEQAKGELLLFLDDDSEPDEGDLLGVARAFDAKPELAAVGFRIRLGALCESGGSFNTVVACGSVLRADAYRQVGGFPERFGYYVEEYELCYRLIAAGFEVRHVHEPSVLHHKATAERDQGRILAQLVRNNRRLLEQSAERSPEIASRLAELLSWYDLLARRYRVEEAVRSARAEKLDDEPASLWAPEVWRKLSGVEPLTRWVEDLQRQGIGGSGVHLWPVGKDVRTFATAANRAGIEVLGLLDPEGRYGAGTFCHLPVTGAPTARGSILVASFSPGQCWNGVVPQRWEGAAVDAGFGYTHLEQGSVTRWLRRRGDRLAESDGDRGGPWPAEVS